MSASGCMYSLYAWFTFIGKGRIPLRYLVADKFEAGRRPAASRNLACHLALVSCRSATSFEPVCDQIASWNLALTVALSRLVLKNVLTSFGGMATLTCGFRFPTWGFLLLGRVWLVIAALSRRGLLLQTE